MEENYLTNEEEQEIDDIIEDDVNLDIEVGHRKIIWQAKDFSIREFLTMKNDGELYDTVLSRKDYEASFVNEYLYES